MAEIGGGDVPMDEPRRYLNRYCDTLERERDALKAENARLRKALQKAAQWFEEYETGHYAKGTPDGNAKAWRNGLRKQTCRAALTGRDSE